jgi:hypothetical protein
VALVLNKVNVPVLAVAMVGLFSVSVPVVAPILTAVAAPAKFTVVAVVLNTFCVVCVPTMVPVDIVILPVPLGSSSRLALVTVVAILLPTIVISSVLNDSAVKEIILTQAESVQEVVDALPGILAA